MTERTGGRCRSPCVLRGGGVGVCIGGLIIQGGSSARGMSFSVGKATDDGAGSCRGSEMEDVRGVAYTDVREAKEDSEVLERFGGGGDGDGQKEGWEGSELKTSGSSAGAGANTGSLAASLTRRSASSRAEDSAPFSL